MNIIEAAKTGKRIRVNDGAVTTGWYSPTDVIPYALIHRDWEVEETPITLTRAQFEAAYRRAFNNSCSPAWCDRLAKELGFGGDE